MNKKTHSRFSYTCVVYFALAVLWLMTASSTWANEAGSISLKGFVPERQTVALIPSPTDDKFHLEIQNSSRASMKLKVRRGRGPASVVVVAPSSAPIRIPAIERGSVFVELEAP